MAEENKISHIVIEDEDLDDKSEDGVDEIVSSYRDPPDGHYRVRPSSFQGIPPTIFFEYPPELGLKRQDDSNIVPKTDGQALEYSCHWERNCIKNAFKRAGFQRTEITNSTVWTSLWAKHHHMADMSQLNFLQKVNHFPNSWCVGRKDRLLRTLTSMKRQHGSHYDFHPIGFILPGDKPYLLRHLQASAIESEANATQEDNLWIMKPVASSCGKGIKLVSPKDILMIPKKKKVIIQKYLPNPYLIDGHKFDLRIYVLVSGVDPLRVYIYEEGLVRMATCKYTLNNTKNRFIHLTNYAVNKKSKAFVIPSATADGPAEDSSKWSLATFKTWLQARTNEATVEATFIKIHDLVVKTMIAAESEITPSFNASAPYYSNCYELFGCDIFLDESLHPHLIEVNVSPSLTGSTPIDKIIKGKLISDLFHLVGFYINDSTSLQKYASSNMFALKSSNVILHDQDEWRRQQIPSKINMEAILTAPANVFQLLLVEDEMSRATCTGFKLLHPLQDTATHYLSLYRSPRFSDHLLTRWVLSGGAKGRYNSEMSAYMKVPPSNKPPTGKSSGNRGRRYSLPDTTEKYSPQRFSLDGIKESRSSKDAAEILRQETAVGKRVRSTSTTLPRLVLPNVVTLHPKMPALSQSHPT